MKLKKKKETIVYIQYVTHTKWQIEECDHLQKYFLSFKCLDEGTKSLCNKYAAENKAGLRIASGKGLKIQNHLEKLEIWYGK